MKKIMRTEVTNYFKQSKEIRDFALNNAKNMLIQQSLINQNCSDFFINQVIYSWLCLPSNKRQIYTLTNRNILHDMLNIVNKEENITAWEDKWKTYENSDLYKQPVIIELTERWQVADPDKEVYMTEIWMYEDKVMFYDGNTDITNVGIGTQFKKLAYLLNTDPNFSLITQIQEKLIKYQLNTSSKPQIKEKGNKKILLWNQTTINISKTETIKTSITRPIDFEKREPVVLERKPHFRKLRNGELRYFTGIQATYYKLKDCEKAGTIVKVC